ncbi:MAG TPA: flagellar motor protein MotB [Stellaceae bacterium]|nr:flagellar motor protein MotB [Stellaceae bacterium]
MAKNQTGTIIVKKVKKGGHAGHHGGAWKVAYADFVTAMMAFFLLLWLLNVTTDVQKRGIADYFDPTLASKSNSGSGGVLGGQTVGTPGSESVAMSVPNFDMSRSAAGQAESDDDNNGSPSSDQNDDSAPPTPTEQPKKLTVEELQKQLAESEQKRFEQAKAALLQAVKEVPDLRALANNLMIDETPEGLRIQIVDQDKTPMFPLGSAEMLDPARKLMSLITQVIMKLPNKISITGHTDSTQYAFSAKYGNWELSADRANASRREFLADGLAPQRIERVVGVADTEPLDKTDPAAPHNRRISIVLLRENADRLAGAAAAASPSPAASAAAPAAASVSPATTPPQPGAAPQAAVTHAAAPPQPQAAAPPAAPQQPAAPPAAPQQAAAAPAATP